MSDEAIKSRLVEIRKVERTVALAESQLEEAKAAAKEAREHFDGLVARLRELVRESDPLFEQ